ncbi:c-type cytochrome [Palleronia caenipelagi]|uniref:Cytochrome c family protein n=1 Tax=Palleronia caenipelagi TaxID=2489174 RepID=A0A547QA11_9RHOB|nr:cytochrome c family protein [Palleronia caenipelagi]TRD23227.1 cytochrome c family protein [Palleronia caenipelagi]
MFLKTVTAVALTALALPAFAEGDAAAGEKVFNKCKSCHAVGEGAKNKVGPMLNGIVGAEAGKVEDFKYSDALMAKAEEGLVWDEESLTAFLTKPKDYIPGTKMSFNGLRKEEEIANVIAYMATFE